MNPNANSFSFNSGAGNFVPRGTPQQQQGGQAGGYQQGYGAPGGGAGYYQQQYGGSQGGYGQPGAGGYYQQYGQQQQPYYGGGQFQQQQFPGGTYNPHAHGGQQFHQPQQQFQQPQQQSSSPAPPAAASGVQDSWEDEEPAAPAPTPVPGARSEDKPAQSKTISIGGPKPAATSNVTISIGGKKVDSTPAATTEDAKPSASAASATTANEEEPAKPKAAESKPVELTPTASTSSATPAQPPASASAKKQATGAEATKKAGAKDADEIAQQITTAADEDTVKDLFGGEADELEGKEHVNVVFIGHVDAGKSTMGGRVLVECGMVDKRTLEKLEKDAKDAGRESWYLSWALDSTAQERSQGKTVEVGRAYFETDKRRYTILDAPGHKSFVPSMIAGAAQADVAILVISARKGEFEAGFEKGGQTREHIVLVKTAGVSRLVIAINKMDEPTVEWSKERYDEILGKLTPFLKGTGYNPKTDVTFMPVSGYTGLGIKNRIDKKVCPWYNGPALLEHLDGMVMADRKRNAPLMMPVSEKYKDMGTIVVGKIESGRVRKGDSVMLMPNRNTVEVTGITTENEEEVNSATCGDNVRLRLRGIDDEDVSVGFVVTSAQKPVHAVHHFEAQLIILDSKNIITAGYGAIMHVHTAAEEVTLSALLHYFDKKTGRKSRRPPQFAKKGQKVIALLETTEAVCLEKYDDYPQLGRFTLRDEGRTIAIGKVTKLIRSEEMPNLAGLSVSGAAAAAATIGNGGL